MPLDHYVSQVHLKKFYAPELGDRMHAVKKADLQQFQCSAKSVCRINDGNTNEYLEEPRAIEEFLKMVEPKYSPAVDKFINREFDFESIHALAGFIAYIIVCSPAGMRINSEIFRGTVAETGRILDRTGKIEPPPSELGANSFTELLETGRIKIDISPKYPQAYGVANILSHVSLFGNSTWEILINPYDDSLFFTSDYPVAIERQGSSGIFNRIVPLTPSLAVRIIPDPTSKNLALDSGFKKFRCRQRRLSHSEVRYLNQLFVRCGETMVFFSQQKEWTLPFIGKHSNYRIEPTTIRIPSGNETMLFTTQSIAKHTST